MHALLVLAGDSDTHSIRRTDRRVIIAPDGLASTKCLRQCTFGRLLQLTQPIRSETLPCKPGLAARSVRVSTAN